MHRVKRLVQVLHLDYGRDVFANDLALRNCFGVWQLVLWSPVWWFCRQNLSSKNASGDNMIRRYRWTLRVSPFLHLTEFTRINKRNFWRQCLIVLERKGISVAGGGSVWKLDSILTEIESLNLTTIPSPEAICCWKITDCWYSSFHPHISGLNLI